MRTAAVLCTLLVLAGCGRAPDKTAPDAAARLARAEAHVRNREAQSRVNHDDVRIAHSASMTALLRHQLGGHGEADARIAAIYDKASPHRPGTDARRELDRRIRDTREGRGYTLVGRDRPAAP